MKYLKNVISTLLALSTVIIVNVSYATLTLKVEDITNGTTTTITDDGVGDVSAAKGFIRSAINMPNGAASTIRIGDDTANLLRSNGAGMIGSVNITSNNPIDLLISVSNTFILDIEDPRAFNDSYMFNTRAFGFDIANNVEIDSFFSRSDILFDTVGATKISPALFGSGSLGDTLVSQKILGPIPMGGPFSLTQTARIHADSGRNISFSFHLNVVPEPSVLLLIGLGLIGLAIQRRKA